MPKPQVSVKNNSLQMAGSGLRFGGWSFFFRGWGLPLFLLLHTIASFYYISQQNITFDEPDYIEYAKRWLHGNPDRIQALDDSKTPLIAITWIPRIVRQLVNPNYELNDYGRKDQKEGRYMMILFSFITALYVYKWCRLLYGNNGWWLPVLMLLFDPLYLAYSTLISTDLACGAFLLAVLYYFRKYLVLGYKSDFWLTALLMGTAIVLKQNLIFLGLLLPLLSFLHHFFNGRLNRFFAANTILYTLGFVLLVVVVINSFYYFHHSFMPFGNYTFESNLFRNLQQNKFLANIPVPLPSSYIHSLDMLKAHADLGAGHPGSTYNGVYLFGTLKLHGGFWYYYLVMLFYKMPIGTIVLLLASMFLFFKKFSLPAFVNRYMFIAVPAMFYFFILSFFNQFQTGIRHLLIIFPLLFIGLGYLFKQLWQASLKWKVGVASLIVYTFITVAVYYPFIIPYTNQFIADKKTVYKKIYDSSIDYGQSDSSLAVFLKNNPEYSAGKATPDTGKYAVLMGDILDAYSLNRSKFKWYLAITPKAQFKYTILLYDITKPDLEKADLQNTNFKIIRGN